MEGLFVHGGVSGVERALAPVAHAIPDGLEAPTALDAVEIAVKVLEDDPRLNAGYGSVLDRKGGLEMDAGIAEGRAGAFGAVANVTVRHPITLARRVLEETPHHLLTGRGAMELAIGMEILAATTEDQVERWRDAREQGALDPEEYGRAEHVDTVGAVALDDHGRLAAGSSTGGVFGKMTGRVGDAPIFGAGFYASESAAVVGTGVGELFLETLACFRVGRLIEDGATPQSACEETVAFLGQRGPGVAGLLALDRQGRFGSAYRGGGMNVGGPDGPVTPVRLEL